MGLLTLVADLPPGRHTPSALPIHFPLPPSYKTRLKTDCLRGRSSYGPRPTGRPLPGQQLNGITIRWSILTYVLRCPSS